MGTLTWDMAHQWIFCSLMKSVNKCTMGFVIPNPIYRKTVKTSLKKKNPKAFVKYKSEYKSFKSMNFLNRIKRRELHINT